MKTEKIGIGETIRVLLVVVKAIVGLIAVVWGLSVLFS
jgi:hypothetical protein